MRTCWLAALCLPLHLACDAARRPIEVSVSPDAHSVERWSASELGRLLAQASGVTINVEDRSSAPACRDGVASLWVRAAADSSAPNPLLAQQAFSVTETRCGSGRVVTMRGGTSQATAWAAHEVLERLGFRFFHPEQTYSPLRLVWPETSLATEQSAGFRSRGMNAHMTHPIELSPPLQGDTGQARDYWTHWLDWNVRLRQTLVQDYDVRDATGTPIEPPGYRSARGFGSHVGLSLLGKQQGEDLVIDADDPRPEAEQIENAVREIRARLPDDVQASDFTFTFNATEFSVEPEDRTLARIDATRRAVASLLPSARVWTINHGTAQQAGASGVRYFDLSQFADPSVGVHVHPLMLYDLHRGAAGSYGNESFAYLYRWLEAQQQVRRISYFPESSWWLTFDLPVPLFLAPATIEARGYDIERLRGMLSANDAATSGVYGHLLFTSGHEWGYWMIDYCVAQMTWNPQMSWRNCLDHVTEVFARGADISTLLQQVAEQQAVDMRDQDVVRLLVGVDTETRSAAAAGIVFHPLPPTMVDMLSWSDQRAAQFESRSLAPLSTMARSYSGWLARMNELLPQQDDAQAKWVREIRDGIEIMMLRARHQYEVYGAVIALRRALLTGDATARAEVSAAQSRATAATAQAREVIARRERDYRYAPEVSIAGDEPGTTNAIANRSVYPYRVLSRTHRLFYWAGPDNELRALVDGGFETVVANQRMLTIDETLVVRTRSAPLASVMVNWGDGTTTNTVGASYSHAYASQGRHNWSLSGQDGARTVAHEDQAWVAERRVVFAKGSLRIEQPTGAGVVQASLPGLALGIGTDNQGPFLAVGRIDDASSIPARDSIVRREREANRSGPSDLPIRLSTLGSVTVHEAVLSWSDGADATRRELRVEGILRTVELIELLVTSGAFDAAGARSLIASTLGYTPNTLPEQVEFVIVGDAGAEIALP